MKKTRIIATSAMVAMLLSGSLIWAQQRGGQLQKSATKQNVSHSNLKARPSTSSSTPATPKTLIVEASKMNVLYVGVDNPVSIKVSGIPSDKIHPTITGGGTISKRGQDYIVRVKKPGVIIISVAVDVNGQRQVVGKKEFRAKRIPDPVAKIARKTGGSISKSELLAQVGIAVELENFDFNTKFIVQSFTVSATIRGYEEEAISNSYHFSSKQKQLISKLRPNKKLFIHNIKAKGPDGTIRMLPAIALKIR